MARKSEGQDARVTVEELTDLVEELRSAAGDMKFMLSMFTNITSHVGPKIKSPNEKTNVKLGAAFEAVIADMQMMHSMFSNFTPYVDRKLISLYQKIDTLECRIQELEANNSDVISNATGCSHQEDGTGLFPASQMAEQEQSTSRLMLTSMEPAQESVKVTTTLPNEEAPDSGRNVSSEENGNRDVFLFGDCLNEGDETSSIYASVGTSCNEAELNKDTSLDASVTSPEPSQDVPHSQHCSEDVERKSSSDSGSEAVERTSSLSSDVLDLDKRATQTEGTSSSVTGAVVASSDAAADFTVPIPESVMEPTNLSRASKLGSKVNIPSSVAASKLTDVTSSSVTPSNEPDPVTSSPVVVESAEMNPSFASASNLDVTDGQESSPVAATGATVITSSATSNTSLFEVKGKGKAPASSSETLTRKQRSQAASSSIPTAVVIPRLTPMSSVEEIVAVAPSSATPGSNESQTPPPSPVATLSPSTPLIVVRDIVTLTSSSAAAGSIEANTPPPSPLQALSSSTPTIMASDTVDLMPSRASTESNESQTLPPYTWLTPPRATQSSNYASSFWTPSSDYPTTSTSSRSTYESRRYSTNSTASVASSSSSGASPTTTKKYEEFISEQMGSKPVTKLGGVGVAIGSRFRARGYTKASDLHDKFQELNGDRQRFTSWFKRTGGGDRRHSNDCFNSLSDYRY